ncbi:sugar kinase [Nocardioides sp. KR10-350]|uniref:sugar kinase n=1 Tax=Nocardioides cheoyonin TaxID=3156615 RepID=UPI0032B3F3E7
MSIDVLVVGEVLVELASDAPLRSGGEMVLGISGDVVNAAAASAAAGARTALLTRIADDELGDVIEQRLDELGVDTSLVRRVPGQQAAYFVHADPTGEREFVYVRRGSAGSTLGPEDVTAAGPEAAGVVLATGVTAALSDSARAAVLEAARRAGRFVYDPNFRPRLTGAEEAAGLLRALAPRAEVVTPACPGETGPLLGTDDPSAAVRLVRGLGAAAAVVTRGADGAVVGDDDGIRVLPPVPAPLLVDQTGAGDSLAGTLAARLALGDGLECAARLGTAAASLVLGGRGGTGCVPSLAEVRAHLTASTEGTGLGAVGVVEQ